jgi:hypothetical protein
MESARLQAGASPIQHTPPEGGRHELETNYHTGSKACPTNTKKAPYGPLYTTYDGSNPVSSLLAEAAMALGAPK